MKKLVSLGRERSWRGSLNLFEVWQRGGSEKEEFEYMKEMEQADAAGSWRPQGGLKASKKQGYFRAWVLLKNNIWRREGGEVRELISEGLC